MNRPGVRRLWNRRGADIGIILIITLFFLFFWKVLFGGKFLLGGDPLAYTYPLRMTAWEMIRQGMLPLWTPLLLSGYPMLSMAQIGLGYPLTWGYLFLPGYWAEQTYILAPYLLSPIFTYAYARSVNRSRLASLLAGLSFSYGGMMLGLISLCGMPTNSAMWLPLILLGIERARTHRLIPNLLLAAGAFALSLLNGFAQSFIYIGAVALAYGAFMTWVGVASTVIDGVELPRQAWWERLRPLAAVVGAFALAAGLAAFQILETMQAKRWSLRRELSYADFSQGPFPFSWTWKSLVDPFTYHGDVSTFVLPLVFGLSVLVSVKAVRHPWRDPRIIFWLVVTVVAWVLMMGIYTPINRLVYYIPFINWVRMPSRHVLEWSFALSILSAYGWDAIRAIVARRPVALLRRRSFSLISGMCLLVLGVALGVGWFKAADPEKDQTAAPIPFFEDLSGPYLRWKAAFTLIAFAIIWLGLQTPSRRWQTGLLLGVLTLICFVEPFIFFSRKATPAALTARRFTVVSPVTRFLQQYPADQHRVYTDIDVFSEQLTEEPRVDPSNLTMLFGLQNAYGYEPLIFKRYSVALGNGRWNSNKYFGVPVPDGTLFNGRSHVLDLLNTTFVVTTSNLNANPEGLMEKEGNKWLPVYHQGDIRIFRNQRALPRAWLVTEAEAQDGREVLRRIRGESKYFFDPRRTALLEIEPHKLPRLSGRPLGPDAFARIINYEPNRLVIETGADQPAILVLSEMHYPGWVATLDGVKTSIHTTNFLLRGVSLPAGSHRVEMRYRAPAARNGAIISLLTLSLMIGLAIYTKRSSER